MKFRERLNLLRSQLHDTLDPLIAKEYVLADCPYHSNIGDQLIWEGEMIFLGETGRRCLYKSSRNLFKPIKLRTDATILFHGGGNLGMLYREHIEFLFKLIDLYPDNRIVIFPQTVYYPDEWSLFDDIVKLNKHKDLHFCVRDRKGYLQLKNGGLRNLYLLPDMAFYIPQERFFVKKPIKVAGSLYMKRNDTELASTDYVVEADFVKDWPTFNNKMFDGIFIAKILNRLACLRFPGMKIIWNRYADKVYRRDLINMGRDFILRHDPITTTRLHAVILALLCDKKVVAIDNSYGKISEFINTWLVGIEEVNLLQTNSKKFK